MAFRHRLWAVAIALVASATPLRADHPVTIVLQSGQQLNGRFADLHDNLVYLRINEREEPRIPVSRIAVIDFNRSRNDVVDSDAGIGRGPHLMILRNGRRIEGRFEGLTGDDRPHVDGHPLEFVFSTPSGEYVRVNADRISRIYLSDAQPTNDDESTAGNVTIRLDDGTDLRGDLRSLDNRGLTVGNRLGASDRRYTLDRIEVIDFDGGAGADPIDRPPELGAGRGPHLLVMRNGRRVSGEFVGLARGTPREGASYLFRADNGRLVTFTPSSASRLYLGDRSTAGDYSAGSLRGRIDVRADQQWTDTGLQVRRGEVYQFNASGEIQLSDNDSDRASPRGAHSGRGASGAPVRNAPAGALIGRVGGTTFLVGDGRAVRMPATGELSLGVNDDHMPDNRGSYDVVIRRQPQGSE